MKLKSFIQKVNASVLGGAMVIALTSILSRILGLVRDRLLASSFGGEGTLDPYFAAFKVPDLVFNVLVLGALSSSFIPVFIHYLKRDGDPGKEEAWKVANSVLNILLVLLFVLGIVLYIFAPQVIRLIAPGFDGEKAGVTIALSRVMLIAIIFFGVSNIVSGILNAMRRFVSFAIAPVMYNLGIIIGIVFLTPRYGIMGLAYGVVCGAFLHLIIQLPSVFRVGFRYRPIIDLRHEGVRKVGALMLPRTLGLAANQIDILINTIIGSTLAAGSITVYNFANNLQNFPINVFGVSLAVAAFPVFSEAFAEKDDEKFRGQFSKTIRRILFLMIPISILILLLRAHIVRIVLGAQEYSWTATYLTAQVLGYFSISLFAQALIPTLARAFYAHQDTKTPVRIALFCVALNVTLALILSRIFGVVGLAIGYSITNIINMLLLYYFLRKKLGDLHDMEIVRSGIRIVAASVAMGLIVIGMKYLVVSGVNMHTFIGVFLQGSIAGLVGIVAFMVFAMLLRCNEIAIIREFFVKIWKQITNGNHPTVPPSDAAHE